MIATKQISFLTLWLIPLKIREREHFVFLVPFTVFGSQCYTFVLGIFWNVGKRVVLGLGIAWVPRAAVGARKKCHLRRHGESEVEHKTEIKHNNIIMEGEENDETRGTGRALEGV